MSRYDDLAARFEAAMMPTYGIPPVAIERGDGCVVWDADGEQYLDFIGGIAVSSLGHAHPALVAAVTAQVSKVAHTSNLFFHEPEIELAERLLDKVGHPGKVFLTSSGTEANEAALKLVRHHKKGHFVAAQYGFHGRTMGALALTGKASIREPFAPFGVDVTFVPYGDIDALKEAVTPECAGVFLEPTQGEAGIVPPPEGYLQAARATCDANGAVLVLDEIQGGIGRTGTWFAYQHEDVVPDVVTVAKGLGGGLPIGACIGLGPYAEVFGKSDHGSTFGGNPVAAAAALAVLDTIEAQDLLAHVAGLGAGLKAGLAHEDVEVVRGKGLWLGVVLKQANAAVVQKAAKDHGFLVNAVQPDVIRIAPPLVVTAGQVETLTDAWPQILQQAGSPGAAT